MPNPVIAFLCDQLASAIAQQTPPLKLVDQPPDHTSSRERVFSRLGRLARETAAELSSARTFFFANVLLRSFDRTMNVASITSPAPRKRRTSVIFVLDQVKPPSCGACRRSHVPCDHQRPCQRCVRMQIRCESTLSSLLSVLCCTLSFDQSTQSICIVSSLVATALLPSAPMHNGSMMRH